MIGSPETRMQTIYLDNAATTPLSPEVREAMRPWLETEFGNPSSRHPLGARAAEAIDRARLQVARALGAEPRRTILTSGGTEANNLAVLGLARARRRRGRHVLIGPTEHPSVRDSAHALREEGFEVEEGRLAGDGSLDLDDFAERLRPDTVLAAQMLANNEFGTVYPIAELGRMLRARAQQALLHVDAVQGLGKLDFTLGELGASSLSVSAHKVHGPKGGGALVLSDDHELRPLAFGGGQERGARPGTENVAAIAGLGCAAEQAVATREATREASSRAREILRRGLSQLPGARFLEPGSEASAPLPNILSVYLPGVPAEVRMHHLEARGVFTSAGSACHSRELEISPALLALGLGAEEARRVLRFSFSRYTEGTELEEAVAILLEVCRELDSVRP